LGDHSRLVDEFEIVNQSSLEQRRANENYERARRAELLQQEQAEEEQSRAQREYRRLKQAEQFKQQQAEEERQRLQRRADFDQARADTELAKLNPGMFRPKAILIENRQQAIRRNLEHARKLIDRHQYAEATTYLLLIDHPKAREWLSKLDALDKSQFESPQETRSPRVNIRLKLKIARESALIKYLSKTLILLFWGTILVISLLVITFSFVGGTTCSDGWRSSSHGSGTCSHHGGIR